MACCAMPGGCDNSALNGGTGCHLCDVVTPGKVTYRTAWQRGSTVITMNGYHRKDSVTKGEAALTRTQGKKRGKK